MNESSEGMEVLPPETVTGSALESIERAQIDMQISTAKRFPRSMEQFKKRGETMVSTDIETAKSCIYRRPVGKEGGVMKYAEGMSIRMAEIVGAAYGNLRIGSILVEQTPRYVKARGVAHDLESNFMSTSEVVESTVTKEGMPFSERMRVVVAKAALAKARRDAMFQVVPRALCKPLEVLARAVAIGSGKTMEERRAAVVEWIKSLSIDMARVWAALGIKGVEDIGVEQLETLTGLRTAIMDKDVGVDEAFPRLNEEAERAFAPAATELLKKKSVTEPADDLPFFSKEGLLEKITNAIAPLTLKKFSGACKEMETSPDTWETDLGDDVKKLEEFLNKLQAAK